MFNISIIVPIYNAEKYLNDCLESIYNQSVLPDQVILVDDGSTDSSHNLVDSYNDRPNTIVVHTENSGPGPARNIGLELATSDYVYFFDSDDIMASDFVEKVKIVATTYMSAEVILFSALSESDSDYTGAYIDTISRMGMSGSLNVESGSVLTELEKANVLNAAVHSFVTKRSLWLTSGIRFPKHYYEDEAVLYPFFAQVKNVFITDEILYTRRIRSSSIMTSNKSVHHALGALTVAQFTLAYYKSNQRTLQTEKSLWIRRISNFMIFYIRVCKEIELKLSFNEIMSIIVELRSFKLLFRFLYNWIK
jgi:glycosyltransferase involved in cell wall biosynthesis